MAATNALWLRNYEYYNHREAPHMMDLESEVRQIKEEMTELSHKIDELAHEREMISLMKVSETSLGPFLEEELDLYSISDAKVVYR